MRKVQFVNNHYYHIYNRGVEKRNIFLEPKDYFRFLDSLREFNRNQQITIREARLSSPEAKPRTKEKLVFILCYCLMLNHFHLLIKQEREKGIEKFMHKLSTGYAMYFNIKYERTGRLFEGPFSAKLIDSDAYLIHLSRYIHLNPVEYIEPDWKEKGIKNWRKAKNFLENYRWSSLNNYLHNKPSNIINKDILGEIIEEQNIDYEELLKSWALKDFEDIAANTLE